tara:strand:+ start:15049 stop:15504 length:456 start_codon:yes stop_codon:yes gene_type:complete
MRKSSRRSGSSDIKPGLDLSSLVDVSFLLLIYFVATSSLRPEESDLGLSLPVDPVSERGRVDLPAFEIFLQGDGSIVGNDEILDSDTTNRDLPELREQLSIYKAASDLLQLDPEISVSADDASQGQRFLDVLNCLASLEINQVNLTMASTR